MSQNYDEVTNLLIKELNNSGINGELFFKKNLKIFDKYIKTFNKYKVVNESEVFFFDEDDTAIFLVIAFTLINNEDLINSIDNMTNEEIKAIILDVYNEQFEQETTIDSISTLNNINRVYKRIRP